ISARIAPRMSPRLSPRRWPMRGSCLCSKASATRTEAPGDGPSPGGAASGHGGEAWSKVPGGGDEEAHEQITTRVGRCCKKPRLETPQDQCCLRPAHHLLEPCVPARWLNPSAHLTVPGMRGRLPGGERVQDATESGAIPC